VEELRVVIAGGGTGGHFFPGLSVAQALHGLAPSSRVTFVGTARGIEARLAPAGGYDFRALPGSGFAGVGLWRRVKALAAVPVASAMSAALLARLRPKAVVGVGGYASLPVGLVAGLAGIPLLLLEQNVAPGLSNRVLGRLAGAVAVAFPQAAGAFGRKARLLGNPVRASLTSVGPEQAPDRPFRLLVFGGSRGARAINEVFAAAAPKLAAFPGGIRILHQTGAEDEARVRAAYAEAGVDAEVRPFIDDMDRAYAWCHACACRAGATTLAELAVVRRAALLVPFPQAAGGHQALNARGLAQLGAALCVDQSDLDSDALLSALGTLADPAERGRMAGAAGALARPEAAREIASLVLAMAGGAP
jgi:UDP-N-acetylglucosamine--N-acetylmuramyl-(pentapeptide) pyrophosphoryl-undecaprenol N-acetylglucosamine transferase